MNRKNVLLIFGGESSEHAVSIASAKNVAAAIDTDRFSVQFCRITRNGKWYLVDGIENDAKGEQLLPQLGEGQLVTAKTQQVVAPDVIFPMLHGKNGEDGSVQGLAQLLHLPIVGCGVLASAIGMDKVKSKEVAKISGANVVPYRTHQQGSAVPTFADATELLGSTLFIKPSRAGSSVGISKVRTAEEYSIALDEAHRHDAVALIESAVSARELEVAIVGTPPHAHISDVGEVIPGEEFYSYDDKYATDSQSKVSIPADIDVSLRTTIQEQAMRIYAAIGCSGLSRVDFFLDSNNTLYFNEINTFPGFTDISMYPKLWSHAGVSYGQLITQLIDDALSRTDMVQVSQNTSDLR